MMIGLKWSDGLSHGPGLATYPSGDRFEGAWVHGKREGPGKYWCKSKNRLIVGVWLNDVMSRGEITDDDTNGITS